MDFVSFLAFLAVTLSRQIDIGCFALLGKRLEHG
jgi:hypothetical protein